MKAVDFFNEGLVVAPEKGDLQKISYTDVRLPPLSISKQPLKVQGVDFNIIDQLLIRICETNRLLRDIWMIVLLNRIKSSELNLYLMCF